MPPPSVPFHHFGVRLDHAPLKMGWMLRRSKGRHEICPGITSRSSPAGASLKGWWDRPVDFACLYFTPAALLAAAGEENPSAGKFEIHPTIAVQSPHPLQAGPHPSTPTPHKATPSARCWGDSIFVSMAALLVNDGRIARDRHRRCKHWRSSRSPIP